VDVTFNCSTDNVGIAGYRIFVNNSPNPFVDFATSQSSGSLTLTVGNLVPNGGYYFNVVAYDAAGNTNAGTVSGIVYTLSNAPATPAGLNVTTFSSSELYITWSGSAGATGYTLYRSNSLNGIYDFLVDTGTATDWFDTNLIENTVYFYKVQAYNASAFSAFSAAVSGQTSQGGDVIAPV
jgi:fibronectin type 3 domain-containing protein